VGRTDEAFSWENLRGKTIIGGRKGGVPEMTLEYVMAQNGVTPHVDAVVDTSVQFNMMAGAFTGGNGDYVALFEPTATEVEQSGHGYILTSIGQESGEIPYTAYFASQTYMKDHSDVIQRFTNAIAKGQNWVENHTDLEVAQAIADQFPDTDLAVLEQVSARYRSIGAWKTVPNMDEADFERLMDVMEKAGELDARVPFETFVTNRFAENVT
jgi:NitT/TauT family transport system substrate-binding protein